VPVQFVHEDVYSSHLSQVLRESRGGNWWRQQIFKLLFLLVVPDALDVTVVIDADVRFVRPVFFLSPRNTSGKPRLLLTTSDAGSDAYDVCNYPYHHGVWKLLGLPVPNSGTHTGIVHQMVSERMAVQRMVQHVENRFRANFSDAVYKVTGGVLQGRRSLSEYELMFAWMFWEERSDIRIVSTPALTHT